jgi:hypothetical protein
MMLSKERKERLRNETVDLLLEMRAAYLAGGSPNVLHHWDIMQSRMRIAARSTSSVEEWATSMSRALQLQAPSVSYSVSLRALADDVREVRAARDFLQLVEDEYGYLMALARGIAEQRKATKEAESVRKEEI